MNTPDIIHFDNVSTLTIEGTEIAHIGTYTILFEVELQNYDLPVASIFQIEVIVQPNCEGSTIVQLELIQDYILPTN